MPAPTPLTPEQRARVRRVARRRADAEQTYRSEILELLAEGAQLAAIAKELGMTRQRLAYQVETLWASE